MIYSTSSIIRNSLLLVLAVLFTISNSIAQIVPVGSGSYITNFPGTDAAGRNTFPSGSPLLTGSALGKPVPTNDWWSNKVKNNHSDNLFNYPFTLKTVPSGLVVSYIPWGVIDNILPVVVGVSGLNAAAAKVSDYSDWTVSLNWNDNNRSFTATSGIAMPFLYFTKDSASLAQVTVNEGAVSIDNEKLIIINARNGADFAVYAPLGSVWLKTGNVYTSNLNGKNYWSLAFIPLTASNVMSVANEYKKYAYVFPKNTLAHWQFNESTSTVRTDFIVEPDVKEGQDTTVLIGLLPHQWAHLAPGSAPLNGYVYQHVRGQIKTTAANRFSVENQFHGILPTLPYVDNYSTGFNPAQLIEKIDAIKNDGLSTWTDSYNEGQVMNRLIQTARIAELAKDTASLAIMLKTIKDRLENWFTAKPGEVAFLFYYNQTWSTLIGYPAGHGQDGNINDHHFHWGYFIHAAAFVEQYEPGWKDKWGAMVNLLVKDAANNDRNSTDYPHLRNFSPYAGHCWANGFATFPQGNDQESTSESMQFNSSLIHWGAVTNNKAIRDLGIYLYTTEQTAIEEYWFDQNKRIFGPNQQYSLVSRVWGNSYDNGTFWTADIAASYGIELYPIHGGSFYLGKDTAYVKRLWTEIEKNTGILSNQVNDNLWHDVYWKYLALIDPSKALTLYNSYPNRNLKFGVSDAQTYHWLHALNVLGNVGNTITANHPLAMVFIKNGVKTYVAHNYTNSPITVTFSDNYSLIVPARSIKTSKDIDIAGILSTPFPQAYPGTQLKVTYTPTFGTPNRVQFVLGDSVIGEKTQAPFEATIPSISLGKKVIYARVYSGNNFSLSNMISVLVGKNVPFNAMPQEIPGTIIPAHYDVFEGGNGQGITYSDNNTKNEGNYRMLEGVDASADANEGNVVGWIGNGEWLTYTVDVKQAGLYQLQVRYASANNNGGGPFSLSSDGIQIGSAIQIPSTGNWGTWATKTVEDVPLKSGIQTLRIFFENGEFNLGKLTFTYSKALNYEQPVADAGENQLIVLPETSATLNGSKSMNPGSATLSYLWKQIYGPSLLTFSNSQVASPSISGLLEGVYLIELSVSNGTYTDKDEVYIISSTTNNIPPTVSINSPSHNSRFVLNEPIKISVMASDLNGSITEVKLYNGTKLIDTRTNYPYEFTWFGQIGVHSFTAIAKDNNGATSVSLPLILNVDSTPSCRGKAFNGDYEYEFSPDLADPTLTFIPSRSGVGSPTCLLYYGTNAGSLPGYQVTPNMPYKLKAANGALIYFYYTYSFPGAGERNTAANKNTYVVGSCKGFPIGLGTINEIQGVQYYPNPVEQNLQISLPNVKTTIHVYNTIGELVDEFTVEQSLVDYDMRNYAAGLYLFKLESAEGVKQFKIVK
ncbi:MAG: glycosyl hydrolase [Bacteroidota bacterium]|nr:glycosyl hydrolase [Bacteroidota bacterium]